MRIDLYFIKNFITLSEVSKYYYGKDLVMIMIKVISDD